MSEIYPVLNPTLKQTEETDTENLNLLENENSVDTPLEDYLYVLGSMKADGKIKVTWEDIAELINNVYGLDHSEIWYRRHYKETEKQKLAESAEPIEGGADVGGAVRFFRSIERQRLRQQDERRSFQREMREASRREELFDLIVDEVKRFEPSEVKHAPRPVKQKAVYAMLSDLHFGIEFDNSVGKYDMEVAKERLLRYADEIKRIGSVNECPDLYLSLMGDMISGNIHGSIRVENRTDAVSQLVGVSELVSLFIKELAGAFNSVFVNSVPGNHSRLDANLDNTLRGEKLDTLVYWYAKAKLSDISNVFFVDNTLDTTIGLFEIFGKNYACVHGDMDADMRISSNRIQKLLPGKLYALLLGHMHVASLTAEDVVYVRNGSVCGSGDDFTIKKRLFAPPVQVCLVLNEHGIDGYFPVNLS